MSADKYPSIFLHQMETIVYILIAAGVATYFIHVQLSGKLCQWCFRPSYNYMDTLLYMLQYITNHDN